MACRRSIPSHQMNQWWLMPSINTTMFHISMAMLCTYTYVSVWSIYIPIMFNDMAMCLIHHTDVIMTTVASLITSLTVVYSTVYSDADQRKHQSSASLSFVWGIHRDRWIPRTKGQLRGKCFHLMTSSCDMAWMADTHPPRKMIMIIDKI